MNFVPFCGYSVLVVRLNLALVKSLYAKIPNGLHSLDFSFWYYKRPLWDIGVILLSLGGAALSGIGLVMGFRRILRAVTRSVRSPSPAGATSPVAGLRRLHGTTLVDSTLSAAGLNISGKWNRSCELTLIRLETGLHAACLEPTVCRPGGRPQAARPALGIVS